MALRPSATTTAILRLTLVTTLASSIVVVAGGTTVWQLEGDRPGSTFRSWGDGIWWALTTLTTVGYGDHVPGTTARGARPRGRGRVQRKPTRGSARRPGRTPGSDRGRAVTPALAGRFG